MLGHMKKLLEIKGSKLLFGGEALENHSIPAVYGAIKPTAVFIPLEEILKENNYDLVTKEIFGPFQVNYILYSSIFSLFFFFCLVLLLDRLKMTSRSSFMHLFLVITGPYSRLSRNTKTTSFRGC